MFPKTVPVFTMYNFHDSTSIFLENLYKRALFDKNSTLKYEYNVTFNSFDSLEVLHCICINTGIWCLNPIVNSGRSCATFGTN